MTRQIAALLRRFPFLLRWPYLIFSRTQARYTVGVVAVVFDSQRRVLVVEHAYHPRLPWGLPGGWVEADEDPADCILRELREELQLEAEVMCVVKARQTAPAHIDLAFLCKAKSAVGELSHELLGYKWFNGGNLPPLKPFHQGAIEMAAKMIAPSKQGDKHGRCLPDNASVDRKEP